MKWTTEDSHPIHDRLLASMAPTPLRVVADTGPAEVQCRACGLLAICVASTTSWTVASFELDGSVVELPRAVGGSETWCCFLCMRRFDVVWRRAAAA